MSGTNARSLRIFISHSAHEVEEPATQKFLDKLVKRINDMPGYTSLTNQKNLTAGDDWLQKLYTWMGLCDAAVILLSPRAVLRANSNWVPRETNLLRWRKSLDARFVVIPVLLGGVTQKQVDEHPFMADILLNSLQTVGGARSEKQQLDNIIAALTSQLAGAATRRAFDALRSCVQNHLQKSAAPGSVENALSRHYRDDTWLPDEFPHQRLSQQMIRHAAMNEVDDVIKDVMLGSTREEKLGKHLFEALFPMRLPAEPACQLLALCRKLEGQGAVLVNANDMWMVEMLLRTGSGLPPADVSRTWKVVQLQNDWGDNDQAEITLRLAEALAEAALGTNGWDDLGNHADPQVELQQRLAALDEQLQDARSFYNAPFVVCARYNPRWGELAAPLAARFPTVVFLFWTGNQLPEVPLGSKCEPLHPTWPAGEDLQLRRTYKNRLQFFES